MYYLLLKMTKSMVLAIICLLFSCAAIAEYLTVHIKNIQSQQGNIFIELMDKNSYEDGEVDSKNIKKVGINNSGVSYRFGPLASGEYSIFVYQDLNNDDELDFSIFSGPTEPVGTSNNAELGLMPPSWEETAFVKNKEDRTIDIILSNP